MKFTGRAITLLLTAILMTVSTPSQAKNHKSSPIPRVQWTLTMENGGGIIGDDTPNKIIEGFYYLGGNFNLIFGRNSNKHIGAGVSSYVGSFDMKYLICGAGLTLLLPVSEIFPVILTLLPSYLRGKHKNSFAISGKLWWGIHSFNYHSTEVAVAGLTLWGGKEIAGTLNGWFVSFGIDISLHIIAIPFGVAFQKIFNH